PTSTPCCDTAGERSAAGSADYYTDSAVGHLVASHISRPHGFHTPDTALQQPPQALLVQVTDSRAYFMPVNYFRTLPSGASLHYSCRWTPKSDARYGDWSGGALRVTGRFQWCFGLLP